MDRPMMEFRLDSKPFGHRAPELLRAAWECLEKEGLPAPVRCGAAILMESGVIHAARTELILHEPQRHALVMSAMQMLRTPERGIRMAVIVRRVLGEQPKVVLPCGSCRMLLHAYGGGDIQLVNASAFHSDLNLVSLDELLPYADGGEGRVIPSGLLARPQE